MQIVLQLHYVIADKEMTIDELFNTPLLAEKNQTTQKAKRLRHTLYSDSRRNVLIQNRILAFGLIQANEGSMFWRNENKSYTLVSDFEEEFPDLVQLANSIGEATFDSKSIDHFMWVSFHQSYAYEDFVEGLKPVLDSESDGQVRYEISDGAFKQIVNRAINDPEHDYAIFVDEINRANVASVFGELITVIEDDKRMQWNMDENRWEGGVRLTLPYSKESFGVPDNLHIVGTMNTADRSIALLDHALRRRFIFVEVVPDAEILKESPGSIKSEDGGSPIDLFRLLKSMNDRIEYLLDRDHLIGHAYFMRVETIQDLSVAFRNNIIPLLQEYFHEDWEKIQIVLQDLTSDHDTDGRPKLHAAPFVKHKVTRPEAKLGNTSEEYEDRRSYEISKKFTADSFRKIYGK